MSRITSGITHFDSIFLYYRLFLAVCTAVKTRSGAGKKNKRFAPPPIDGNRSLIPEDSILSRANISKREGALCLLQPKSFCRGAFDRGNDDPTICGEHEHRSAAGDKVRSRTLHPETRGSGWGGVGAWLGMEGRRTSKRCGQLRCQSRPGGWNGDLKGPRPGSLAGLAERGPIGRLPMVAACRRAWQPERAAAEVSTEFRNTPRGGAAGNGIDVGCFVTGALSPSSVLARGDRFRLPSCPPLRSGGANPAQGKLPRTAAMMASGASS